MVSRRSFVCMSAAAATGAATRPSRAQAQRSSAAPAGDLPPAIKALASMKDQAKPITVDERRARIERARGLMKNNSIDAVLLTGGTSLEYFTGIRWGLSERLLAAVVPATGSAF